MRLLTSHFPLRRATDLAEYRADFAERWLPVVIGRATVNAIALDRAGADWLVADHAVASVDAVTLDGKPLAYERLARTDAEGRTMTRVRLAQPQRTGQVVARVTGLQDTQTGAVIERPAAVLRALCALAGLAPEAGDYDELDIAASLSLVIDTPATLRDLVSQVTQALGAVWTVGRARVATPDSTPRYTFGVREIERISASARLEEIYSSARVSYARDHASSTPRGSVRLVAAGLAQQIGDQAIADIDVGIVASAAEAIAIGSRRLASMAVAQWAVSLDLGLRTGGRVELLDTIRIDHPHAPAGLALVTGRTLDRARGTVTLDAVMPADAAPRIDVARVGAAIDPADPDAGGVLYRDGIATFNIVDDQGRPLAGAAVTLDGAQTANTNARGQVTFKASRGAHTLLVNASGYAPFEMGVTV